MKDNDTAPPRRRVGRPRVVEGEQRFLGFYAAEEQAAQLDALLPRPRQRSAALREALALVLARLAAAQAAAAPAHAQATTP